MAHCYLSDQVSQTSHTMLEMSCCKTNEMRHGRFLCFELLDGNGCCVLSEGKMR